MAKCRPYSDTDLGFKFGVLGIIEQEKMLSLATEKVLSSDSK